MKLVMNQPSECEQDTCGGPLVSRSIKPQYFDIRGRLIIACPAQLIYIERSPDIVDDNQDLCEISKLQRDQRPF